jgi:succinoglycan biosynthesis transport protein ExoP
LALAGDHFATTEEPPVKSAVSFSRVDDVGNISFLFSVIRRHRRAIVAASLIGLAAGVLYFLIAPSTYTAASRILIDYRRLAIIGQDEYNAISKISDSAVDSQSTIIQSEAIVRGVIRKLDLDNDPEFIGRSGILSKLGLVTSPDQLSPDERMQAAVDTFRSDLHADRVGLSYVIEIAFNSRDPDKAANVANALASAYVQDQLHANRQVAQSADTWFQGSVGALQRQAAEAQSAAVAYRSKNNILLAGGKFVDEQQVADISSKLVTAKTRAAEARAKLDQIQAVINSGDVGGSVADEFNNAVITSLREKYIDLDRFVAEKSAQYGDDQEYVKRARADMQRLSQSIIGELKRIAQGYQSDASIADQQVNTMTAALDALGSQSSDAQKARVELAKLQSTADAFQHIRDDFMSRYAEVAQNQSFPITEARVVALAPAPTTPSAPKIRKALVIGLALGFFGGFVLALGRDLFARRVRSRVHLETATRTPCLALIPLMAEWSPRSRRLTWNKRTWRPAWKNGRPAGPPTSAKFEYAVMNPATPFAEAFRAIKVGVSRPGAGGRCKVIGVVEAAAGDGASTIAANLANLLARGGERSLLIDADFHRCSLTAAYAPDATVGIADIVASASLLSSALKVNPRTGMRFLAAALGDKVSHPSEVLTSSVMNRFLGPARRVFDWIIVDFSPILMIAEARAVADLIDGFILVSAWNRTSLDTIADAMAANPGIAERLLGGVVNRVNIAEAQRAGDVTAAYNIDYFRRYKT